MMMKLMIGIELNQETVKMLKDSNFHRHMELIVDLDNTFKWDSDFVQKRTDRILEIVWNRIEAWFFEK